MYGKGQLNDLSPLLPTNDTLTNPPEAPAIGTSSNIVPFEAPHLAAAALPVQAQSPQPAEAPAAKAPAKKSPKRPKKITVRTLMRMKQRGEKITMLTAYDAMFAGLLDRAGVEMLLVGDSLGMVVQGADHTLEVTLEDMIYHTRCVARGSQRAMVVGDLPFMSYQVSPEQALESAGRMIKEGHAHAVKLEGGADVVEAVRRITRAGIPVIGHLGLTPQSVHAFGGFVVQGRSPERAAEIKADALALQEAGACAIVLEGIPVALAEEITASLDVPTIGIGAGDSCDGQVLVVYDMLGMSPDFKPRFVKTYKNLHDSISDAVESYVEDVKEQRFPQPEHTFS